MPIGSSESTALDVCPVCSVSITVDDQVRFSSGQPGTRARLYARVCQYTQNPSCINQDPELIGELTKSDRYEPGQDIVLTPDSSGDS
ncbi:MAG: hypothetical protein AB4042_00475 [Leptolyngbyaceae cyanobacterium]